MNNMKLNKKIITLTMGGIALVLLLVILSTIGSVNLSLGEIFSALINNDNKMVTTIVYKMRLPRNILAALVGANLAVSGLLLQKLTGRPRNNRCFNRGKCYGGNNTFIITSLH